MTVDRNRFRCQSRLEKKTCMRNGFEKPNFGPWDFQVTAEKAKQSKNLAGGLKTETVRYKLSVAREFKMEIPV